MAEEFDIYGTDDLHAISSHVHDHFQVSDKPLKAVITQKSNGTISMLKLWKMWMVDIATYKAARGAVMPLYIDDKAKP